MPREDIALGNWTIPNAYPVPWGWNQSYAYPPGEFVWDEGETTLTYTHTLYGDVCIRTWDRNAFKTAYVAWRTAKAAMEVYCRERNLLTNEYRKLSDDVMEFVVGKRTTIISGVLVGNLLYYRWDLKEFDDGELGIVALIKGEEVPLQRFLMKAVAGETVRYLTNDTFNHLKENLILENPQPEGILLRANKWTLSPDGDDNEDDYMETAPPLPAPPPGPTVPVVKDDPHFDPLAKPPLEDHFPLFVSMQDPKTFTTIAAMLDSTRPMFYESVMLDVRDPLTDYDDDDPIEPPSFEEEGESAPDET